MDADVPAVTHDLGLERLRSGVLTLVRHSRQHNPNLRQIAVLSLLVSTKGPHTIRGFAATLRVSKPAITRAVDRLEKDGLAKRLPDPADLRSVLVRATKSGIGLARTMSAPLASEAC
jgi:DNA-binding MarR family transcriptional regulator